jgi:hypothetical protein
MSADPRPPVDEATWRNRFIIINLVRIGGTFVTLFGLFIWQTDFFRAGGWAGVGVPLTVIGLLVSFGAPQWLARRWRTPPDR